METGKAYATLGSYVIQAGDFQKGFQLLKRAIYIKEVCCGDLHPELASSYLNLGVMYMEIDNPEAAIECFEKALEQNTQLFGQEHVQVASCYQLIASSYQNMQDFRMALDYQEKSHQILVKLFNENDAIVQNSLATIDQFTKLSVQKELNKKQESKGKRAFGTNKKEKSSKNEGNFPILPGTLRAANYTSLAHWLNLAQPPQEPEKKD